MFTDNPISTNHDFGVQYIFRYPNGYGASVVKNAFSYGNEQGLYELAVIMFPNNIHNDPDDFQLVGNSDILPDGDVIGYLTIEAVNGYLTQIAAL